MPHIRLRNNSVRSITNVLVVGRLRFGSDTNWEIRPFVRTVRSCVHLRDDVASDVGRWKRDFRSAACVWVAPRVVHALPHVVGFGLGDCVLGVQRCARGLHGGALELLFVFWCF